MKTVMVIFGGRTPEHDVSVISALSSVIRPLEIIGDFRIECVYIAKDGAWYWDDQLKDISLYRSGKVDAFLSKNSSPWLEFDGGLKLVKQSKMGRVAKQNIDIVFPVMHGSYGEDGSLMGLLEMAGVPYVGCGVTASALAMDKVLAKQVVQTCDIPTAKYVWCTKDQLTTDPDSVSERIESLKYPLFVKPAHAGSSIGITKVQSKEGLMNALEVAAHYDNKIIVEEGVRNLIEVTLPIMGNAIPQPALLEQPLVSEAEFFDFETKYMHGGKAKGKSNSGKQGAQGYSNLPAKIPEELYKKAESIGLDVYRALGCSGIARVDMLINSETKEVFFNEVNPMPGSLYAHNWREAGVSGTELVIRLLKLAEESYSEKQKIQTSFQTNFLKQF